MTEIRIATGWSLVPGLVLFGAALAFHRPAAAVPAFAEQTGRNCAACHVGGFGPELTPFGREFKLGGYTLRMHGSVPLSAMAIASRTHTKKDQDPAPEHLSRNDNLVLDQASLFVAGGIGSHFGGFAQLATYDGVERHWSWDNIDLRAVTDARLFGEDSTLGLTLNNNPTAQDPWNTLPAWGFPFTDSAVSGTPDAGELIDDPLGGNTVGLTAYGWLAHKFYLEGGAYSSPSRGFLRFVGMDPTDPGSLHGVAPYGRIAYQTDLAGGTFEVGANVLKAAIFPGRDRTSGMSDHYTDWGIDSSWLTTVGKQGSLSANLRYEHENGNLRASCALGLVGDGADVGCAHFRLNEWQASFRYTWRGKVGFTVSPFSITGSRNDNLYDSGSPNSNGVMGQIDYTPWGAGNSPLGPRVNARIGVQYTLYGKFNGRRYNFDGEGANASDNNALRAFTWIAF